ncbi:MAG TPA: hypothetical protein ENK01_01555 [Hellea balneolensis]|uniref:Uncharacterized protein n=1 Tax=Hellea balneolensis TaxID=287478 RepID=A0A7V5NWK6_9PROT|nr:hypothetical protein [Hellea balneolensis]
MTNLTAAPKILRNTLITLGLGFGVSSLALTACAYGPQAQDNEKPKAQQTQGEMTQALNADEEKTQAPVQDETQQPDESNTDMTPETPPSKSGYEGAEAQVEPDTANETEDTASSSPEGDAAKPAPNADQKETGSAEEAINGCFAQPDGKVECLCDTAEHCETLKQSDLCAEGTFWSGENDSGGCTQKARNK